MKTLAAAIVLAALAVAGGITYTRNYYNRAWR